MKFESPEEKAVRIERISKYFSEDSQFLLYRPPTPDLSAEMMRLEKVDEIHLEDDEGKNEENENKIIEEPQEDLQRESSIVTPHFNQILNPSDKEIERKEKREDIPKTYESMAEKNEE